MKIVIDTNVLMAGLIKDSIVRIVLLSKNINFFIPEYSLSEIKKYEEALLEKSGYDKDELKDLINYLLENVKIIQKSRISDYIKEAEKIMKNIDIKDSSFIATAIAISADGIWSYDEDFNKQKEIKVFTIRELIDNL